MKKSKAYIGRIIEQGRGFAARRINDIRANRENGVLDELSKQSSALLSAKGQASGIKVAAELLTLYAHSTDIEKGHFFQFLLTEFGRDKEELVKICTAYGNAPSHDNLKTLALVMEPKRQELIRRINLAPGGTSALVQMRADLLEHIRLNPELKPVDLDFLHLFKSWFNRGFLTMQAISWTSPALILERLIAYESVHEITSWEDLKRRLDPKDRRCYAFFHPNLANDPLIFVEVALSDDIPVSIQDILSPDRDILKDGKEKVAAFYSINNCLKGLKGISFGNFLIKQVVEDLRGENPKLSKFVTLSPIPGLTDWLNAESRASSFQITQEDIKRLQTADWFKDQKFTDSLQASLRSAALAYLLDRQPNSHRLHDSVARFHLGNGARIENIQWLANTSGHGIETSFGMMVNYLYELDQIEDNHEAFAVRHETALSNEMKSLNKRKIQSVKKQ